MEAMLSVIHKGVPVQRHLLEVEQPQARNYSAINARMRQNFISFHEKAESIRNIDMLRNKYEVWPNNGQSSPNQTKQDFLRKLPQIGAQEKARLWVATSKFYITPIDIFPWSSDREISNRGEE